MCLCGGIALNHPCHRVTSSMPKRYPSIGLRNCLGPQDQADDLGYTDVSPAKGSQMSLYLHAHVKHSTRAMKVIGNAALLLRCICEPITSYSFIAKFSLLRWAAIFRLWRPDHTYTSVNLIASGLWHHSALGLQRTVGTWADHPKSELHREAFLCSAFVLKSTIHSLKDVSLRDSHPHAPSRLCASCISTDSLARHSIW